MTRHQRLLRLEKSVREQNLELTEDQIRALERFSPEFLADLTVEFESQVKIM